MNSKQKIAKIVQKVLNEYYHRAISKNIKKGLAKANNLKQNRKLST